MEDRLALPEWKGEAGHVSKWTGQEYTWRLQETQSREATLTNKYTKWRFHMEKY